jgi:hypothetical protein
MLDRCTNPSHISFHRYGGQGIAICETWQGRWGFHNFCNDMGDKPTPEHTLDRYPNRTGEYRQSNCRWATLSEQQRNKDSTTLHEHNGALKTLNQIAADAGIPPRTIYWRVQQGQSIEAALRPSTYRQTLAYQGETLTIADWSKRLGLPVNTIQKRLSSEEWTAEEVLAVPYRQHLSTWRKQQLSSPDR